MSINGKNVAIIIADGFESSEYQVPKDALEKAGARTTTISLKKGEVRGWSDKNWASSVTAELAIADADTEDYDAVILPGGTMNPDILRQNQDVIDFVKCMYDCGKPIAAICHGPWTLINAGIVEGKKMTSYRSIRLDLINAGADWSDEEVVVDNGLVTSRSPDDLPAFCKKIVEEIEEGIHQRQDMHQQAIAQGGQ